MGRFNCQALLVYKMTSTKEAEIETVLKRTPVNGTGLSLSTVKVKTVGMTFVIGTSFRLTTNFINPLTQYMRQNLSFLF